MNPSSPSRLRRLSQWASLVIAAMMWLAPLGAFAQTPAVNGMPTAISTGQVSVTTAATVVCPQRYGRKSCVIVQEGTTLVRLGTSTVTAGTGVPLPGVQYASFTFDGGAPIYGIVGTGTQTVSYIEMY